MESRRSSRDECRGERDEMGLGVRLREQLPHVTWWAWDHLALLHRSTAVGHLARFSNDEFDRQAPLEQTFTFAIIEPAVEVSGRSHLRPRACLR